VRRLFGLRPGSADSRDGAADSLTPLAEPWISWFWPPGGRHGRRDSCWQSTVVRSSSPSQGPNRRLTGVNLSPSGDWNVYPSLCYRAAWKPETRLSVGCLRGENVKPGFAYSVDLSLIWPRLGSPGLDMAVKPMLEQQRARRSSYWALAQARAPEADFDEPSRNFCLQQQGSVRSERALRLQFVQKASAAPIDGLHAWVVLAAAAGCERLRLLRKARVPR